MEREREVDLISVWVVGISCFGVRVSCSGFQVSGFEFQDSGFRFRDSCFVLQVPGFGTRDPSFEVPGVGTAVGRIYGFRFRSRVSNSGLHDFDFGVGFGFPILGFNRRCRLPDAALAARAHDHVLHPRQPR